MNNRFKIVPIVGMLLTLVGVVVYSIEAPYATDDLWQLLGLTHAQESVFYTIGWISTLSGGLLMFFCRLSERMHDNEKERRRLHATLMFSAVAICVAAYLMMVCKKYWLLPLLLTAGLEFYASYRIGSKSVEKKS